MKKEQGPPVGTYPGAPRVKPPDFIIFSNRPPGAHPGATCGAHPTFTPQGNPEVCPAEYLLLFFFSGNGPFVVAWGEGSGDTCTLRLPPGIPRTVDSFSYENAYPGLTPGISPVKWTISPPPVGEARGVPRGYVPTGGPWGNF